MGLDQYAYIASKAGAAYDDPSRQEIAYWRKHPNLQGWMERLWLSKVGNDTDTFGIYDDPFNGVELELVWEDISKLEADIKSGEMAKLGTTGFFFGKPSDDHYYEYDLEFCATAKSDLFLGRKVFYNSSW
jgi:hypothetical protein